MDCRDTGLSDQKGRGKLALSTSERISCLPQAYLALPGASPTSPITPLAPGTYVEMVYANLDKMNGYQIVRIGRKNLTITENDADGLRVKFDTSPFSAPQLLNRDGLAPAPGDPGIYSWSNRAKQKTATYLPTKQLLYNGDLEKSGLLVSDQETGARLIKDALPDFLRMNEAYKRRWGRPLYSSGYRTYNGQVYARMIRVKGDDANCPDNRYGNGKRGEGAGERNANCKFVGYAAIPGTSNHGWGSAIDIDRTKAGFTNGRGGNSPQFQWLNKYGPGNFNFNFVICFSFFKSLI